MRTARASLCRLLLVAILSLCAGAGLEAEEIEPGALVVEPDRQFAFAMDYFDRGRYFEAINEFERFNHFFPEHERVDLALYKIGEAYFNNGQFKEAVAPFSRVIERYENPVLANKAYFRLSETFVALEDYASAFGLLNHVAETATDPAIRDEAHYRAGWIHLARDEVEKARESFQTIAEQNRRLFRIGEIEEGLSGDPLYPTKNPKLAGFLSVVPGAGFAYVGRYKDALAAFLLNAGLALAAYESFDNGNEALGAIIVFVGAGFYGGNFYGAISSAHKYNLASRQRFLENLKTNTGVTLSYLPENNGLALGLRYSF
jgi:tetratricopeptide (TPR) repeat protein